MNLQAEKEAKTLRYRMISGVIGVAISLLVFFLIPDDKFEHAPIAAAIITLMAAFWVMEVIPIAVTSIFPLILFPLFGIVDFLDILPNYYKSILFLFIGGFILAHGLQESGIHKRIALKIVNVVGGNPRRLILGFMIATGFLSMWIANTASVMVMLPIGLSIIDNVRRQTQDEKLSRKFGLCVMLSIAYSADIGGMATLVGTPPNMVFLEMYHELFPDAQSIGFMDWMIVGLPISIIFITVGWYVMSHWIFRFPKGSFFKDNSEVKEKLRALGPMTRDEKIVGIIFVTAALLWMTSSDIRISNDFVIHGWRHWFNIEMKTDGIVAMIMGSILLLIPSMRKEGGQVLPVRRLSRIPFGILLLFGGGFAIAAGFEPSGLSELVKQASSSLPQMSPILIMAIVCLLVTFMTELTTNTAITTLVLPLLATSAVVWSIDPRLLMIPATLTASCAFMTPVASPTQAIVFGSGYVTMRQMMRVGIWFNLLGVGLVVLLFSIINAVWWS